MSDRYSRLRRKEVVHICEGCRLGFVNDLIFENSTGQICALIVPGRSRFFGIFGREEDYVIPWECIRRIGNDIVLVDGDWNLWRTPPQKKCFFS